MLRLRNLIFLLIAIPSFSCREEATVSKTSGKKKQKSNFVFRERMVRGDDTAMIHLRASVEAVLAQHWYLDDPAAVSDDKLVWENGDGSRLFPSLNLFPDSTALENPRSGLKLATWHRELSDKINTIVINYGEKQTRTYRIRELSLRNLTVSWKEGADSFWIRYRSDGMAHQDMRNDPYYPSNNRWRIKPDHKESETEIRNRVKDCVRFYALYYRDHIKRHKKVIEFLGLPEIFRWYNGGIGLPMKGEMSESWANCFYNRNQAERGYDILKNLIDVNEFDWPTGTPGWHYRTHSVLEQMYEKL
ncbi:hypothetical protein [Flavitalea sp.]|nr:hypothetical protein [Flavitalea sp.]